MPEPRQAILTGGCQCGAVRYALLSEQTNASICHCRMCQKAFGSYFAPLTGVPPRDLSWVRGSPATFRSSEAAERGFCRDCGTPLTFRYVDKDRICVSLGSLDDPARVVPIKQYGLESRLPFLDSILHAPGSRTEDDVPPEARARFKSRQHPDRG